MDLSHLDKKYFLDGHRYNCPFCNRGSVRYKAIGKITFNWSRDKEAYGYVVKCQEAECSKISFHLSYFSFDRDPSGAFLYRFDWRPDNQDDDVAYDDTRLDEYFFYHQPTSFFTLDERIDRTLRELIEEAQGSLKMNFLVGASACLRKTVYELIDLEDVRKFRSNGRTDYQESVKALKEKFPRVPEGYFDALAGIQELASDKVHEGSWPAWDSKKLAILLELTKSVLYEMYVLPEEQKARAATVIQMREEFKLDQAGQCGLANIPNADGVVRLAEGDSAERQGQP